MLAKSGHPEQNPTINQIYVCELAGLSAYLEPDEEAAFKTEKETMTAEGLIKIIYVFLKTS